MILVYKLFLDIFKMDGFELRLLVFKDVRDNDFVGVTDFTILVGEGVFLHEIVFIIESD